MSRCAFELISPATTAMPVVHMLSQATRLYGSCSNMPSRTASLIWSHILSGWPSVTDSDVNMNRLTFASLVAVASAGSCGRSAKPPSPRSFHSCGIVGEDRRDSIEEEIRQLALVEQGRLLPRTGRVQQDCPVRVDFEARIGGRHVVRHHHVDALAGQLLGGVLLDVLGLGREPDEQLPGLLTLAELGEHVGRWLEHDLGHPVALLELLVRLRLGP